MNPTLLLMYVSAAVRPILLRDSILDLYMIDNTNTGDDAPPADTIICVFPRPRHVPSHKEFAFASASTAALMMAEVSVEVLGR